MSTQTNLRILITLIFLALLTACGASSSGAGSQDVSSTGDVTPSKPIVKCNKASSTNLSYKVAAQVSGNGFDPNIANVYLSTTSAAFEAGTSYIQFSKGQPTSDSTLGYNSTPISFAIYDRQTFAYLDSAKLFTVLKWNDVKNLISGATPASFMSRVIFVLALYQG